MAKLTLQQLETHLWGAANILRGKTGGQDYKNYILSLMFYKRLCDQWEQETEEAIAELEQQQGHPFTDKQKEIFRKRGEHRFKIPEGAHWDNVKMTSVNIGEVLTKAMRVVADANEELRGVFNIDWNLPAPDRSGKPLIANEVVHSLIMHFDEHDLSNKCVQPDMLGRAYEYLIKKFADDAGAKAGEFFTPPEVVDTLVRILEPQPGDTIYDPTSGSGGMLIHSADFLRQNGHHATSALYYAQEMNWGNAAIGKINSVLHGLEANIAAGTSTITDPIFLDNEKVKKFSLVLANFPFSDEFWWLRPEQKIDDKNKKDKLKKEIFGKEGYKDPFGRFGRGTAFKSPPPGYGDYAFILHILASLENNGRAGIVCPRGVLFRGQPELEEETDEIDNNGDPIIKHRKADDEYSIRRSLLESRFIDAVISLPEKIFYGAPIPACLLIVKKERQPQNLEKVLFIYAEQHYRKLSAQNELRPQDVMRILVHYHTYGDVSKVSGLVAQYSKYIHRLIHQREEDEIGRLLALYQKETERFTSVNSEIEKTLNTLQEATKKSEVNRLKLTLANLEAQLEKLTLKIAERDLYIAETRQKAIIDRKDVVSAGEELIVLYQDPDELKKHTRVVDITEIEENEFNLNVPRYISILKHGNLLNVQDALKALSDVEDESRKSEMRLKKILMGIGYDT